MFIELYLYGVKHTTVNCLFVSLPAIGHIKPLVAIEKVLTAQGHNCYFLSSLAMEFYFKQIDLNVVYSHTHNIQMERNSPKKKPYRKQIADFVYLTKAVEKEIELIKSLQIDLLFVDAFISVPISANLTKIPWISHLPGPTWLEGGTPFFAYADTTDESLQILKVLEHFNVTDVDSEWPSILYSPYLNLVSGIREFSKDDCYGIDKIKNRIQFIGGLSCGQNITPFKDIDFFTPSILITPSAFASLGTLNGNTELYEIICRAVKKSILSSTLVTTGIVSPQILRETLSSSPRINFKRFVPSEKILPHVDVAIIHGGYNSILECLYHGVPMLIIPANRGSDQIANGLNVALLGAGLLVDWPYESNDVARKIDILLTDNKYRMTCKNISKLLNNIDGEHIVQDKIVEVMINYDGQN